MQFKRVATILLATSTVLFSVACGAGRSTQPKAASEPRACKKMTLVKVRSWDNATYDVVYYSQTQSTRMILGIVFPGAVATFIVPEDASGRVEVEEHGPSERGQRVSIKIYCG